MGHDSDKVEDCSRCKALIAELIELEATLRQIENDLLQIQAALLTPVKGELV